MQGTDVWRGAVYKMAEPTKYPDNWEEIREAILYRDKRRCLRCDKVFPKRDLSVHHVVPRSEDGSDQPQNLVTLCHKCHDHVELNEYRVVADIIGSYADGSPVKLPKEKPINNRKDNFDRPNWHKYVYGGARRN